MYVGLPSSYLYFLSKMIAHFQKKRPFADPYLANYLLQSLHPSCFLQAIPSCLPSFVNLITILLCVLAHIACFICLSQTLTLFFAYYFSFCPDLFEFYSSSTIYAVPLSFVREHRTQPVELFDELLHLDSEQLMTFAKLVGWMQPSCSGGVHKTQYYTV